MSPQRSDSSFVRAALAVAAAALVVLAAELLLRVVGTPSWIDPGDRDHDTLLTPHPVRGYALKPGLERQWSREDWSIRVHFNERGMRAPPVGELGAADVRVLAVGDSFTMGIGVGPEQTWAAQLERLLAERMFPDRVVRVANAGVPGYSPRQIRLTIDELLPLLHPQAVIFGYYAGSHWRIQDPYMLFGEQIVSTSSLPYLYLGYDGSVIYSPFESESLRRVDFWLKQHFFLGARLLALAGQVLDLSRRQWKSYADVPDSELEAAHQGALAEILAAQKLLVAAHVPLVVLLINRQQDDGTFSPRDAVYNRIVGDFCLAHGVPVVDPLSVLIDQAEGRRVFAYAHDLHWTPPAHRIAAEQLYQALEQRRLLHE